jgi:hypothetical protein
MVEHGGPEIVFGLVGAVGTNLELISRFLAEALGEVNYKCETVHLSKLMRDLPLSPWKELPDSPEYERYDKRMTGGDDFREFLNRGDALALLAVAAIREARQEARGNSDYPLPRQVYVLRSLKHPDEVRSLRSIYGPSFFLISAYCPARGAQEKSCSKTRRERVQHSGRSVL